MNRLRHFWNLWRIKRSGKRLAQAFAKSAVEAQRFTESMNALIATAQAKEDEQKHRGDPA